MYYICSMYNMSRKVGQTTKWIAVISKIEINWLKRKLPMYVIMQLKRQLPKIQNMKLAQKYPAHFRAFLVKLKNVQKFEWNVCLLLSFDIYSNIYINELISYNIPSFSHHFIYEGHLVFSKKSLQSFRSSLLVKSRLWDFLIPRSWMSASLRFFSKVSAWNCE